MADNELRQHVERLEHRLEEYHEHLTHVVEQRDELTLDASWGTTQALTLALSKITPLVAGLVFGFAAYKATTSTWIASIFGAMIYFAVDHFESKRVWNRLTADRDADRKSMKPLPLWKSEAEKLW